MKQNRFVNVSLLCKRRVLNLVLLSIVFLATHAKASGEPEATPLETEPIVASVPEEGDEFGGSQASGDFNNDGYLDLAVGASGKAVGLVPSSGVVNIFYGNANGLSTHNDYLVYQEQPNTTNSIAIDASGLFGITLAAADFNNDGHDDLAVTLTADINGVGNTGAVQIFYGDASGLANASESNQLIFQGAILDGHKVKGALDPGDSFGEALATGDFDGDGYFDLAIGTPRDYINIIVDAGSVNVLYGSASGLTANNDDYWNQNNLRIRGIGEFGDFFGNALASGDFNNDGRDDLAIGVPYESIGRISEAGAVNILYGTASGLTASNSQIWHQNKLEVQSVAEKGDGFGFALASGDFNNDGPDDLAIGVFGKTVGDHWNAGAVNVLYGTTSGLTVSGNQIWNQNTPDIEGVTKSFSFFGATLSVGYFNNDNHADLAIGVPNETIGDLTNIGAVNVIYGSASGLNSDGNQYWTENTPLVPNSAEVNDGYGSSLASGDFNGDGLYELSVGVPYQDINNLDCVGAVNILYGSNNGLTAQQNQYLSQD